MHETFSYSLEERCVVLMEDVEINSRVIANGNIMEYGVRMDFGFSRT
jgi:hypothetical protein